MDTIRVYAAHELGAPIEFVNDTLRVDGNRAFTMVTAQRLGGVPIDMMKTPYVARYGADPSFNLDSTIQAFLHRQGGVSPNDVW